MSKPNPNKTSTISFYTHTMMQTRFTK